MYPKTVAEIRNAYLSYFKSKNHVHVSSSSLIPAGDPSLLFTTAGMVQFKPLFTGAVELPYTRATSSQKCLRTTDLERVGKTERHCTFFEMLGNFSFGDYFKKEAIEYALDFSVNHLGFPVDKIWISVYEDDDEAIELWVKAGIPRERIVRLGKADNFWGPAGETGACGPCSELYFDRGIEKGFEGCGNKASCKPGCDCDRFLEYWNLVFNQFDQDKTGKLNPLKQTGIDTGSGLERIALLIQNVDSVYDTDELKKIIQSIETLSGVSYTKNNAASFRVLTDHARAVCFAISDGIYPDRTGRGYVIRRLIRRASLYARKIGLKETFFYKLIPVIAEIYQNSYPELKVKEAQVCSIVLAEEKLFLNTLELGLDQLENILQTYLAKKETVFKGVDSFRLYSTFGFPPEMTKELLEERGMVFDEKSFQEELEKDRAIARDSWKGKKESLLTGIESPSITVFTGYHSFSGTSEINLIFKDSNLVNSLQAGEQGVLVTKETPFYAEGGGQVGDTGYIKTNTALFKVTDTQKENDTFLHIGEVLKGEFTPGTEVELEIDSNRRNLLAYHHSGTHLLNGALRSILGTHVMQKASLVSSEHLRFDFSHPNALSTKELEQIEEKVNEAIQTGVEVVTTVLPIAEAKAKGAVAAFDEKYGDKVRVVEMDTFSLELCGGCHVKNTRDIQYFLITKESSPGAGNRRIEAVCGPPVISYFQEAFQALEEEIQALNMQVNELKTPVSELMIRKNAPGPEEVEKLFLSKGAGAVKELRILKAHLSEQLETNKQALFKEKKKQQNLENRDLLSRSDELNQKAIEVKKVRVIQEIFEGEIPLDALKQLADKIKNTGKPTLILFALKTSSNLTLLYMCNKEATKEGVQCNQLLKDTAPIASGRGGGKPEMAQGSAKDADKIQDVFQEVLNILKK
ncbi:MAG: alanine--tRNA ligase [Leptospiraceae bacterium]|nr:alanine--tRNA ligase [Leptospiraceae bacterium]MCP5500710.1 alanine--tRNA ligase [Leptospiraceae bacterium]